MPHKVLQGTGQQHLGSPNDIPSNGFHICNNATQLCTSVGRTTATVAALLSRNSGIEDMPKT
jgi:hypothetical protein